MGRLVWFEPGVQITEEEFKAVTKPRWWQFRLKRILKKQNKIFSCSKSDLDEKLYKWLVDPAWELKNVRTKDGIVWKPT